MQLWAIFVFINNCKYTLHVSSASCAHHQENYKLHGNSNIKFEKENRVMGAQLRNAAEFKYFDFGAIIRNENYIHNKTKSARSLQNET